MKIYCPNCGNQLEKNKLPGYYWEEDTTEFEGRVTRTGYVCSECGSDGEVLISHSGEITSQMEVDEDE